MQAGLRSGGEGALRRQPRRPGLDNMGSARSAGLGFSILAPGLLSSSETGASSASGEQELGGQWGWAKPRGLQRPAEGVQESRRPRLSPRKRDAGREE